ncbi:stress-induced protein, KGG, repeat-containing protein [Weissella paramesenteroides]|uniref:general stress protein B n=1 Tax=Weissella paramesenteroides TaxID=1249 RepID=UPI002880585C|nr:general stress protein B [Weissella paramesenteroides]MCS9984468.1 stress-induced protein, KGG, repeat-containing protein [Weissella paramesenteroides]MCS9998230.1 stress-induced protein, KGG, repeat-containing protein [Weissella paramesenteroides]MCT0259767.1 stress-induced protein, KGG, repeat-containing protein [Weissella paramesenteroides]
MVAVSRDLRRYNYGRKKDDKLTREESGEKGGEATVKSHDKDFYEKIGKKGGEATAKSHDKDFYPENGEN